MNQYSSTPLAKSYIYTVQMRHPEFWSLGIDWVSEIPDDIKEKFNLTLCEYSHSACENNQSVQIGVVRCTIGSKIIG